MIPVTSVCGDPNDKDDGKHLLPDQTKEEERELRKARLGSWDWSGVEEDNNNNNLDDKSAGAEEGDGKEDLRLELESELGSEDNNKIC